MNQDIQLNLEPNGFFVQYFFSQDNHRYSWDMHNGLAGHQPYAQRHARMDELRKDIQSKLNQAFADPGKRKHTSTLYEILKFLVAHLGEPGHDLKTGSGAIQMNYHLISGYSRSGGTYLTSEYAKIRGYDIQDKHLYWSHDFYPHFSLEHLSSCMLHNHPERYIQDGVLVYLSTLLSHAILNQENHFFKRTTLGPAIVPYLEKLTRNEIDVNLIWRHGIRDLNGLFLSLQKMYSGYEDLHQGESYSQGLIQIYGEQIRCDSLFGLVATAWFINNLSILPIHMGLPFIDIPVSLQQEPRQIINAVNQLIDLHLQKFQKVNYNPGFAPTVLKYGPQFETQCQKDAQHLGVPDYQPSQLHYQAKDEIDDPYSSVYQCFLSNITRLYQNYQINFDGKLERI